MQHEALVQALAGIVNRILSQARDDAQLCLHLRQLAQAVLDATNHSERGDSTPDAPDEQDFEDGDFEMSVVGVDGEILVPPARASDQQMSVEEPVKLPKLTLGQSALPIETAAQSFPVQRQEATELDFGLIEVRCRLKADGARWAATRRRLLSEGATFATEIEPLDRDIIGKAKKLQDCFLWMCHPRGPSPTDVRLYEDVACCFEAVADLMAVLKQVQNEPELHRKEFEQAMDLLAEAQSALRVAVDAVDGPADTDQLQVFSWLKETASEAQIFIQRHMRANDPADPSQAVGLLSKIEILDARVQEQGKQAKQRRKLIGKIRHKLKQITDDPASADANWRILSTTVDELVNDGMPPSNRVLRDMLAPVIDEMPDLVELPKGFQLVLREIDRFLATSPPPGSNSVKTPTPEVVEVRKRLKDHSAVLIGGDRRRATEKALKDALNLKELIWIETREHQSIDSFEAYISQPDVAVVLLGIRWSSHSFGDIQAFCDRHGKPLVRLPGGYGANQVAAQIMGQVSERLPVP